MTREWINQKIKKAHENAVEKGFYECSECKGKGVFDPCKHKGCYNHVSHPCEGCGRYQGKCQTCNGIGIYRNIGELLMLIITELSEAVEAHRKNNFVIKGMIESVENSLKNDSYNYFENRFIKYIKDTFEDEIADTFIRLFDLCGYMKIELKVNKNVFYLTGWGNICNDFIMIIEQLLNKDFKFVFNLLSGFCQFHKIDIEKHIELKMTYNKTRPHKHGKEY